MTLEDIKDIVDPHDFKRNNHLKVYKIFAKIFDICKTDIKSVFHNFFPLLSDSATIQKHSSALFIPKYPADTETEWKERTAQATEWLERLGTRGLLIEYLEAFFAGRYTMIEFSKTSWYLGYRILGVNTFLHSIRGFRLYIDDLSDAEKESIEAFLDDFLEADIEFYVYKRN